jgi:superfamily II DNA/RNA helicase
MIWYLRTLFWQLLVLDEADRLLDMGFKTQLDNIMACLPKWVAIALAVFGDVKLCS